MRRRRGGAAHPFLKWAGGKTQLLGAILERVPEHIHTYYEPFVGGGAVFFALAAGRRFRRAVLADRNPELIDVYRAIQTDVEKLVRALERYGYSEQEYYAARESKPRSLIGRAARTIYLNRTGYNGLYRVNASGGFNVPFGRYVNPKICDEANLRAVARVLAGVELGVADFEETCSRARPSDFVYLDPPYVPLSRSSSFTAYDRHAFALPEQKRLAELFGLLHDRGVPALLSNSNAPETRKLYARWSCEKVPAARSINSRADARGAIFELLVTNEPRTARAACRKTRPSRCESSQP